MSSTQNGSNLDSQMEAVLDLLTKRAKGEATSDQVEEAVSGILTNMGHKPSNNHPPGPSPNSVPQTKISMDHSNYDDDDDDDENDDDNNDTTKQQPLSKKNQKCQMKDEEVSDDEDGFDDEEYQDQLSQIPLGKEGAKMMTTFGDGPRPNLKAVEAALLGARKSLQLAIMDARAIRRKAKQHFEEARQTVTRRNKAPVADSVDPNMLFRALSGNDRLGRQPKCGFDVEQLTWLFPEEMRSYQRWNEMHSEYTKNAEKEENSEGDDETSETPPSENTETIGGHLKERAANFDIRTEKMKSEWYLKKFAKVRQGSFLPRGTRHRKTADEVDWDEGRKGKRGRRVAGVWESMSSISVRFLHWLSFDPPALCPPNEETTQALGFLGYDMLGKIVEKAIFLRNLNRMRENQAEIDETKVLWELKKGEQLSKEDIDNAMADPDIRPASLHTLEESSQPSFQLYFGPGFEDRLELEMEELVASEKNVGLSEEELRIRKDEASLFSKISASPTVSDGLTQLLEQRREEEEQMSRGEKKARVE